MWARIGLWRSPKIPPSRGVESGQSWLQGWLQSRQELESSPQTRCTRIAKEQKVSIPISLSSWLSQLFWMLPSSKLMISPSFPSNFSVSLKSSWLKSTFSWKRSQQVPLPLGQTEHVLPWNLLTLVKKSAMCHLFPYCLKTADIASIITDPVRGCRKATWSTKQTQDVSSIFLLSLHQTLSFTRV